MFSYIMLLLLFIVLLALFIVITKNPIQAVVSLITIYFLTAVLFLMWGAEFLSLILIIVYVGAISVLFLFIVMMLNSRLLQLYKNELIIMSVLSFVFLIFILELFCVYFFQLEIFSCYFVEYNFYNQWIFNYRWPVDLKVIGQLLLNYYYILLCISGIILLIAMIGAIVLTYEPVPDKFKNFCDPKITRVPNKNIKWIDSSYGVYTKKKK